MVERGPTQIPVQEQPNPVATIRRTSITYRGYTESITCTYETTIKVAIGIFALIVCNVLVIRTLMLTIIPLLGLVAENPCLPNSTFTAKIASMVYNSSSEYIR